jgi:hypothetical protein
MTQIFEEAARRILQKEKLSKKMKKTASTGGKLSKDKNFELPNLNYGNEKKKGGCCN